MLINNSLLPNNQLIKTMPRNRCVNRENACQQKKLKNNNYIYTLDKMNITYICWHFEVVFQASFYLIGEYLNGT